MILVVGSTGSLGSSICELLRAQGRAVRGLCRPSSDLARVRTLTSLGVELVEGDLKDPASLARACEGVDAVISTATTTLRDQTRDAIGSVDHDGQLALVDAAARAGVRRFVYVSYPTGFDGPEPSPLSLAKRAVEARLRAGGMTFTILQPVAFLEVWMGPALGFDYARGQVRILGSGEGRVSWIATRDVARYAVASLDSDEARDVTIELVGDVMSPNDAVRLFEQTSGRSFEVTRVPVEALEAQRATATTDLDRSFVDIMLTLARGFEVERSAFQRQAGFEPRSVADYVSSVATPASTS
ncbi:SDR family oxidoreductase [Deinococcus pimensis]|uniref:SDR family oxidoreductase n=1 Tax=Deinococcus pimensis TaxID=309888 RepID=UPI0004B4B444|nr:SDR family oxidoreductase [Deinococcus pimensis]